MRSRKLMIVVLILTTVYVETTRAQVNSYAMHQSARSDKFTGGHIEHAELVVGDPDIKITVDVPAFRLTLWQSGREVRTYQIGVGQKEYPIYIGTREATGIIWNPSWIPPDSDWVAEHKGVRPGQVIKAGSAQNPIGKLKIPLGDAYLIHQAAKPTDLGHLVSHGCIRMLRPDLYDLAEKIVAARSLPVSAREIALAKQTTKMLDVKLDTPVPVDINYDTQVVEGGVLHLYADIYDRRTNTIENLRAELQSSGVDASRLDDEALREMLKRANKNEEYVVSLESIRNGRALEDGHLQPLINSTTTKRPALRKRSRTRKA